MPTLEADGIVLRTIRYGEADAILSLHTREDGRLSAIAKGARKSTSRLGGRLQPGVWARFSLIRGRGDMHTVRSAQVVRAHAGLWTDGYRLRAAGCVLEAAMRVLPEHEPGEEGFNLIARTLGLLTEAPPRQAHPRLDPLVLGFGAKLLVVSGLLPRLTACASCGVGPPLPAFSAAVGGALCPACGAGAEPLDTGTRQALAALVSGPLAAADGAVAPGTALGVERLVGLVLREHLGVTLRSATPV
jgi:DNA repair protein RecO (recombination protein O)